MLRVFQEPRKSKNKERRKKSNKKIVQQTNGPLFLLTNHGKAAPRLYCRYLLSPASSINKITTLHPNLIAFSTHHASDITQPISPKLINSSRAMKILLTESSSSITLRSRSKHSGSIVSPLAHTFQSPDQQTLISHCPCLPRSSLSIIHISG